MNQAVKKEQVAASKKLTKAEIAKSMRDSFFVISSKKWDSLYYKGASIIDMASYLVLACGTGADHKTTSWSAKAIYQHAGISPRPATKSIMHLDRDGFIDTKKPAKQGVFPVYKIRFDKNPKIDKDGDNIYIPAGVVTGVDGEKSPLERLVNAQDQLLLYLFIRLYAFQDKELDAIDPGIASSIICSEPVEPPIVVYNESNLINLWTTGESISLTAYPKSDFFDFNRNLFTRTRLDSDEDEYEDEIGVWAFFNTLKYLGLVEYRYVVSRGDSCTLDTFDPVFEITKTKQQACVDALEKIADEKGKLNGGGEKEFEFTRGGLNGIFFVAPAAYKKLHIQILIKLRYRTNKGASKVKYALQNKYEKDLNLLFQKVSGN